MRKSIPEDSKTQNYKIGSKMAEISGTKLNILFNEIKINKKNLLKFTQIKLFGFPIDIIWEKNIDNLMDKFMKIVDI